MFLHTDTEHAPWTVIKSNDKKRARLEAMRHILSRLPYSGRDEDKVGVPDPLIVVPGRRRPGGGGGRGSARPRQPELRSRTIAGSRRHPTDADGRATRRG